MSEQERHDTRLDRFVDSYSQRTNGMRVSAVRALFAVANRPEIVSLAGGMPNIADLPLHGIAQSIAAMIEHNGAQVMQYGSGQGELGLREQILEVVALEGITAHPDDIVITAGSQQGLDLVTRIFCDPGDVILAESPSYVGAIGTFLSYQTEVVHIPGDDGGIDPVALLETTRRLRAEGKRVKFLYTIPNYNNPSGTTQSMERRREVLSVCESQGVIVVEDNPYGLLSLDADPIPAMRSIDPNVIYLGSFSKTFAPGFRVGWTLAPHGVREKLVLAQESATLCPPVFSQFAISTYLSTQDWQGQIGVFKDMYRQRRDAMLTGLEEHMPEGSTWTHPAGGFFVWATLPEGVDSQAMLPRAVDARVAYVPGPAFYADGDGARNVRLSYCFPTPERIRVGVQRFADVIRNELEVMSTFGIRVSPTRLRRAPGPSPDLT
ncbi:DNA-binding transcriptional regulator, MocR family, contains an aminotransferase domain [Tessaracoccus bendigoensis DSM 12906]|uniref:DNA-binding transcriptional regulator, MocR family, contains an aminotransferase domain n=1 Tax=Tessaracoccus bendigoensis DSM 12906 TaxID=1123357 RepID=A0A1M6FK16_9ACTN|nr:PLP-dependent aminotransferase family protein [Tessaracoccus bendigoensis]SHI98037.1 DNA-binding transcriptional regulator, MocR family, contains an aminotransferase domain [Tessaracoccus bendigoensis DSM 12906]